MITDLIKFTIKREHLAEAVEHMKEQIIHSRDERGCQMSKLFHSKSNPCELYALFGWENRKAVEIHTNSDYNRAFIKNVGHMLVRPPEFIDWETII